MRLRRTVLAALLSCLAGLAATAAAETPAHSPLTAEARSALVGTHKMSLQWIDWGDLDNAGTVAIEDRGGILTVHGQETSGENRLDVNGQITGVTENGFVFEGAITIQLHNSDVRSPCTRSGRMHFATRDNRKYWRLQEMQSPCSSHIDYVDIYFLGI